MTVLSYLARHAQNSHATRNTQAGFGMAHILAGVAISLLIIDGFSSMMAYYRATPRVTETAAHLEKVSLAAAHYVKDNFGELTSTLPLNGAASTVLLSTIEDAGYFSPALGQTNPYGQSYSLRVRYVTQGSGANTRNVIEPMVVTQSGQAIPDNELLRIASKLKAGGSIRSSDPTKAIGNSGGWEVEMADFGGSPGAGHLAVGMFYSDAGMMDDYLYRHAVPGRPEVNQMNTDIDMAGNSISDADTIQTAEAHLTRIVADASACAPNGALARNSAGTPMVCEDGLWNQSATLGTVAGQGQRMRMTAANGQTMWIQNDNGRFRWVNSDWSAELASVDQSGNLSASGRVRSGEYVEIGGVAVEGQTCSPDGLIGRTATGLILSCQSGIWTPQFALDAKSTNYNTASFNFDCTATGYSGGYPCRAVRHTVTVDRPSAVVASIYAAHGLEPSHDLVVGIMVDGSTCAGNRFMSVYGYYAQSSASCSRWVGPGTSTVTLYLTSSTNAAIRPGITVIGGVLVM